MDGITRERPIRVLLVDDDAMVLRSVARLLGSVEPDWSVETASTAEEAIAVFERQAVDLVLSDLNLGTPAMSGAELLSFVQERHPDVVRILLTGQATPEMAHRSLPTAHLLLQKPFERRELHAKLKRALQLRQLLTNERLRGLVGASNRLPSPPKVFHEVAVALAGRRAGVEDVALLIERDVALSAQLIRLVSSAFFGLPRRVRSVRGAIAYLGFNTVKTLVLSAAIVEQYRMSQPVRGFDLEALQSHALASAHIARQVIGQPSASETAFSAAMLQNVGQLLLASRAPHEYSEVLIRQREGAPPELSEVDVFGVAHPAVGAYLLGIWGLPGVLIRGVLSHHELQRTVAQRMDVPLAVNIASKLARDPAVPALDDAGDDPFVIDLGHLKELALAHVLPEWRAAAERVLSTPEGDAG